MSTRCATLKVTSGSWDDGKSKCTDLGLVQSAEVFNGGTGYKSGTAMINQGATGLGLNAICNVDSATGQILSVSVSEKGRGMPLTPAFLAQVPAPPQRVASPTTARRAAWSTFPLSNGP